MSNPLDSFAPAVRIWFQETFGAPTPPQEQGWRPIQRGEHTLILAPTGSGKTLAAFLWGIDELERTAGEGAGGVRLLYISPLKALSNDIERNLRVPLEGIRAVAATRGDELPELRVAVRTGDTPSHARTAMWKRPPHILITTPESLYLMLTSPRAREMFRTVRTVIVDEIHTLSGTKRGVHLSLSLERLEHLAAAPVQRIGLSATIKPLDEVAHFLGGTGRPVTPVNATYPKRLDLRVITVVPDFRELPVTSIWPMIVPRVLQDIREHRSTLIFTNNRRLAERTADRLNAQLAAEQSEEIAPGSSAALAPGGIARDRGIFALGAEGPIRAHHGSMSKEARRKMEEDLKAGHLPALVGTSSLELGIDIGSVDLVVQLQSPKSVAQGLQRVGRSGHLVGETSVGHIYTTFREDVVEAAAIARGMLEGDVEPTYTPQSPLDVLAQQTAAMVSVEDWNATELYDLVKQAYAYRDLTRQAFDTVLGMLSGKYERVRARLVWDRVNDRLAALPGTRLLAITNPGTISDTGAYGVYLEDRKTKVGELDEEFIYETRAGDAFLLGSKVWRVLEIENDRVVVGDAAGATPRMPFWNGDYPWRPYELGKRIGSFRREIAERIQSRRGDPAQLEKELERDYALDENSAANLVAHVARQLDAVGVMSSDTTIIVESFQDAVGEPRVVIHSPFGGRVNGAWALALTSAIRERTGVQPETQTNDDGVLFRFPQGIEPPVDLTREMSAAEARERILRELPNSALFGAHFRMNAARALLLPKARGQKRTPFWLQRLKARDLLASVRQYPDFPVSVETYRDCLSDVLDLPHLEEMLNGIAGGQIRVVPIETAMPSPVASALLFQFISVYMYEWDAPKAERQLQALSVQRELLNDLLKGVDLSELLKPEAVSEIEAHAQHRAPGYQARTAEELAVVLQELGDLTTDELVIRSAGDAHAWIRELAAHGRIVEIEIPTRRGSAKRWVPKELEGEYAQLAQGERVLRRLLRASGPATREDILDRYAFDERWLDEMLAQLGAEQEILQGHFSPEPRERTQPEFVDRRNLEQIHRRTLALLRKQVQAVPLYAYAAFIARWQHLTPSRQFSGEAGLRQALGQLRGASMPAAVWERDALPGRVTDFAPDDLDALCASGELIAVARHNHLQFFFRGEGSLFLPEADDRALSQDAHAVYVALKSEGASFTVDMERAHLLGPGVSLAGALAELVTAGLVTNDSLDALREAMAAPGRPPAPRGSALENELAARLTGPRPFTRGRYENAKRRVAARLKAEYKPAPQGRWSPVYRTAVLGAPLSDGARVPELANVLLARYGVLTRECLEHEELPVDWSALYPDLQRMEMRGEVRRGYFVAGLSGLQFATTAAVEELRAPVDDALIVLNATDPANVFGGELPGVAARFARVASTSLVLYQGKPVLVAEDHGAKMTTDAETSTDVTRRALEMWLARPNAPRHLAITEWNGGPVLASPAEELLKSLGFHRTPGGMDY